VDQQIINVAKEFSAYPFGRSYDQGKHNAARFRKEHLGPALRSGDTVTVDLTGVFGMSASYLQEAFGGLIDDGFELADLERRLTIKAADDRSLAEQAWLEIRDAAARRMAVH
jgi:hypothetical protein